MQKKDKVSTKEFWKVDFAEISIERAVQLLETAYEGYDKSVLIPFKDFEKIVNLHGGTLSSVIRALKDYGFMDKHSKRDYRITELGRKILRDKSKSDVLNAWLSIKIHKKVYSQYGDTLANVNKKVVERYLTDSEKLSASDAVRLSRLVLESFSYISSLHDWKKVEPMNEENQAINIDTINVEKWLRLIQLKYALQPPKGSISELVDKIAEEFRDVNEVSIQTLVKLMKDNKHNNETLITLVAGLIDILTKMYPIEALQLVKDSEKTENSE